MTSLLPIDPAIAEQIPERIMARSIRVGDFVHGRRTEPPVEVFGAETEGRVTTITFAGGKKLVVYRGDMVRVTMQEWAGREAAS
jgi:hypothetical protein